jgi:two-component system NtrC family sensor kinase
VAAAGRFASNVAHEVNNPLTVILMGVSFLLEDIPEGQPLRKDVSNIKTEAERIRTFLRLLSDYAHTELGDRRLVDFHDAVMSAIKEAAPRMRQQNIKGRCVFSREPVIASADPQRFRQVLTIIIDNALKAMPAGGRLEVRTARSNGQALVIIEDSGCGIRPDHLPHIFEPMFTTSNTTGMGLAFARRIIKLHGGSLSVESAPGAGSGFTLALPLAVPYGVPN